MTSVTDEMVYTAFAAHNRHVAEISGYNTVEAMRAALEAALEVRMRSVLNQTRDAIMPAEYYMRENE